MFQSDIRQWCCPTSFMSHIQQHSPSVCSWVKNIVIHHTWKPVPSQWNGTASMNALQRYYTSLGWNAGPHLFICTGSKHPSTDGIFQLTPLNIKGIHANRCNPYSIGIEVVGNYDTQFWSDSTAKFVYETIAHLLQWTNLPVSSVIGHRDCGSPKTCPGKAISLDFVRLQVEKTQRGLYAR